MFYQLLSTIIRTRLSRQTGNATHLIHLTVYLPLNLLSSRSFVHEPEDLLVYPERASRLDAYKPPPTLPLTLIQHLFKEGLKGTARDGLHHLGRILSYILTIPVKRVRSAI
jgi:hypothetical protein